MSRALIVNADDFGLTEGVNGGVIAAHERGIVTSASLMVRQQATEAAARYARATGSLGLGLHVDLGEWRFIDGSWSTQYAHADVSDAQSVEAEVRSQLAAFEQLVDKRPTHLDSHQHVHRREPVRSVLLAIADEYGIVLRHESLVAYCGEFYGQTEDGSPLPGRLEASNLVRIVQRLPGGVTELCCHPADIGDAPAPYTDERVEELRALCDPAVRSCVITEGIDLRAFGGAQP